MAEDNDLRDRIREGTTTDKDASRVDTIMFMFFVAGFLLGYLVGKF